MGIIEGIIQAIGTSLTTLVDLLLAFLRSIVSLFQNILNLF